MLFPCLRAAERRVGNLGGREGNAGLASLHASGPANFAASARPPVPRRETAAQHLRIHRCFPCNLFFFAQDTRKKRKMRKRSGKQEGKTCPAVSTPIFFLASNTRRNHESCRKWKSIRLTFCTCLFLVTPFESNLKPTKTVVAPLQNQNVDFFLSLSSMCW